VRDAVARRTACSATLGSNFLTQQQNKPTLDLPEMTTTEHLENIKAKCRANLALAEKRTPGRWVFSQDYGDERMQVVHTDEDEPWFLVEETHGAPHPKCNAAYIAACAGDAERAWLSTADEIEGLLPLLGRPEIETPLSRYAHRRAAMILAAWPEDSL
jgi:hypothetical protein